jgi:hypothetical protein
MRIQILIRCSANTMVLNLNMPQHKLATSQNGKNKPSVVKRKY